jgi:hypothetical protein
VHVNRVTNPGNRNVIKKEAEKILKYKDLILEKFSACGGATGTISKSHSQYLSNIPRKHEIKELQKKKKPYWALHTYCRKC